MKSTQSLACLLPLLFPMAGQATSFGALSNFDAVNDTGSPCNGFEIELDDITSKDVTYTFSYQRYGTPKIIDDSSDPAHPKVFVRWMSAYDQANHVFTATTPVAQPGFGDTGGHACFTGMNPNGVPYDTSGCEHFGVGTLKNASNTVYRWMKEDPAAPGSLVALGSPVSIPAPAWTVNQVNNVVNVQAVIPVPPPPAVLPVPIQPNAEFGVASWAKVLETESAEPGVLKDLVSDSDRVPGNKGPNGNPPNTVTEFEWQVLQTDTKNPAVNELAIDKPMGAGNENVTRRYEFYKYIGPYDLYEADGQPGTNEALCSKVGPDGSHGEAGHVVNTYEANRVSKSIDCGDVVVVGDYIGAQMAGVDVALPLSANDPNLPDAEVGVAYPDRPLIFGGSGVYDIQFTQGTVPNANPVFSLDPATGILIGGKPSIPGSATFTVHAKDQADGKTLDRTFTLNVLDAVTVDDVAVSEGVPNAETQVSLTATGGSSPFVWSAAPATQGLVATLAGGTLKLNAGAEGAYSVQVTVTDSLGGTATKTLSYTVGPAVNPVAITTATLPDGQVNQAYATTVVGTGGTGPLSFSATGLPDGLLMAASGEIKGTPNASGTFQVAVKATDPDPLVAAATSNLSLTIAPAPVQKAVPVPVAITTSALPNGRLNQPYAATVAGTGGTGALNFSAAGLPAGLDMDSSGAISGTPLEFGTFRVSVSATDDDPTLAGVPRELSLTIVPDFACKKPKGGKPAQGKGKITAVGDGYIMVGSAKVYVPSCAKLAWKRGVAEFAVGQRVNWNGYSNASVGKVAKAVTVR